MKLPSKDSLFKIYGETEYSFKRYEKLADGFKRCFGYEPPEFFSAPGRAEIIGNHTDHNGGLVLAAGIGLDTIGAAAPNDSDKIHIVSEGYDDIIISLTSIEKTNRLCGTPALLCGMAKAVTHYGFNISGFDAYISTTVISAAGVSSSASFEMLICSIINYFFNNSKMTCTDYAHIGKFAENIYWDKASGMLDQMACALGNAVLLDFSDIDNISFKPMEFSFTEYGYQMFIINTGRGHADLSEEYSAVPNEMKLVADAIGCSTLFQTNKETLLKNIYKIENDRAILRAIHFFDENERVKLAASAIENHDIDTLLDIINASGNSSYKLLQNCYSLTDCAEQKIPLVLTLTEMFIKNCGKGACRVHGGGFAGTVMAVIPAKYSQEYIKFISKYVGEDNVYPMNIRNAGAIHLD